MFLIICLTTKTVTWWEVLPYVMKHILWTILCYKFFWLWHTVIGTISRYSKWFEGLGWCSWPFQNCFLSFNLQQLLLTTSKNHPNYQIFEYISFLWVNIIQSRSTTFKYMPYISTIQSSRKLLAESDDNDLIL